MTRAKLTDLNAFAYYPFPFDVGEIVGMHRNGSLDDESVGTTVDGEYEGEQRGYTVTYTVKRLTDGMYYEARNLDLVKLKLFEPRPFWLVSGGLADVYH